MGHRVCTLDVYVALSRYACVNIHRDAHCFCTHSILYMFLLVLFFVFLFSMKIKFHINRMLKIKWKIIIDELNKINEGISFANIQGKRRIGFGYFWWMFIPVVFFIRNWLRLHSFFFYLHFRNIIAKSKLIAHNKKNRSSIRSHVHFS